MTATATVQVELIPLNRIGISPHNPRKITDAEPSLKELAASIAAHGVLQPITVRKRAEGFEIVAGERRFRACKLAGLDAVPALVRELDDATALEVTVVENLQREDLSPLEEASGVAELLGGGWDVPKIADKLGKSPTWVARRARLHKLSDAWKKELAKPRHNFEDFSATHLEMIAALVPEIQDSLLKQWRQWGHFSPSVKELGRRLSDHTRLLSQAPFPLDDESLVPKAGACLTCPNRSSHTPGLFAEYEAESKSPEKHDRCLHSTCWTKKVAALAERKEVELRRQHPELVILTTTHTHYDPTTGKKVEPRKDARSAGHYEEVKAGTKGAQPALVVDGPDAGKFRWMKPHSWTRAAKKEAKPAKAAGEKAAAPTPAEQKEKRLQLERRRKAQAMDRFKGLLNELTPGKASGLQRPTILRLAALFGGSSATFDDDAVEKVFKHWGGHSDDKAADADKLFDQLDDQELLYRRLWTQMRPKLREWSTQYVKLDEHFDDCWKRCEWLANLCGLHNDLVAALRAAVEEIPEPKAWASWSKPAAKKAAATKPSPRKPAAKPASKPAARPKRRPVVDGKAAAAGD